MITFEKAQEILHSMPVYKIFEKISFENSRNRVLAEAIRSDIDMPPFDKSAMDGYACREEDLALPMILIEEIPAGKLPERNIEPGTCSRIMTGAPLPEGADTVIMEEETHIETDGRIAYTGTLIKNNICQRAEDVRAGDVLIEKGTLIKPAHIAIMASAGATSFLVSKKPSFAVYSTGDELVEPHVTPTGSMIRNSNGYQIKAQLEAAGFGASLAGIIPDTLQSTELAINKGFEDHDILILTGGVSMGDYDFVPQVMNKCGIEVLFHKLAVQPGKPVLCGRRADGKYIFGLPGNPVSSFIQTELLVKPFAYHLQGHHLHQPEIQIPMGEPYHRKRGDRMAFVPVEIRLGELFPVEYHGSAHIQAMHKTHGFITMAQGELTLEKGALAHVRLI